MTVRCDHRARGARDAIRAFQQGHQCRAVMDDQVGAIDHTLVGCRVQIRPGMLVRRNVVDSPDQLCAAPSSLVQSIQELAALPFWRVLVDPSVERLGPVEMNQLRTDCSVCIGSRHRRSPAGRASDNVGRSSRTHGFPSIR